jgi:transcription elongation factor Elf1
LSYEIVCPVCDIVSKVTVVYDDDNIPRHCPMCGEDVEVEVEEDDLEWED